MSVGAATVWTLLSHVQQGGLHVLLGMCPACTPLLSMCCLPAAAPGDAVQLAMRDSLGAPAAG